MYQREASSVLKVPLQEISEDYLGVAPIRSGDSVIIYEWSAVWRDSEMKSVLYDESSGYRQQASRVEPR